MNKVGLKLNAFIEHTLLRADATALEIKQIAMEAVRFNFYAICVNPFYVSYARSVLGLANVKIVTVVGFPLGASLTATKVAEAKAALQDGVDEIDMVLNIGAFKNKNFDEVVADVKAVKAMLKNKVLKVILETALLTSDEIIQASKLVASAGADFVKTSTGFSTRGASLDDILLIKKALKDYPNVGIKASGGIKNAAQARLLISAGATRLGTSQGLAMMRDDGETSSNPATSY